MLPSTAYVAIGMSAVSLQYEKTIPGMTRVFKVLSRHCKDDFSVYCDRWTTEVNAVFPEQ